ncbi:nucleotidyltransferase domain-containing protein [Candidatus Woesearchaeota archaeon]|nr:nucleotidyltransferase domain-containing protein [Candidatus Woesearchaeota archaeon]
MLCIKAEQKLNQREISRELKATPTGIAKALKPLQKANIVKIEKNQTMNLNLISLNRTQQILKLKQIENLKQIHEINLTETLEEKFPGTTIILFGSYCRGEDTTNSDIDIVIIGTKSKTTNLEIQENKLQRKININFYNSLKMINKKLKENICNGITLSGAIEL